MPSFFVNNANNFTLLHQNIQGLASKKELIEITLSDLSLTVDPDVICLTETFIKSGEEKYINIKGYELASCYCRDKKRGGSCIMVKSGMSVKKINCFDEIATSFHFECCSILISYNNVLIVCIYRTPSKIVRYLEYFFNKLELLLHKCLTKYPKKRIIITGDLNINTLEKSSSASRFTEIVKSFNLNLHITEPTRGSACLDHIVSNIPEAAGSLLPLWLSDHETAQLLNFQVHSKKIIPKSIFMFKRSYTHENIEKFKNCLSSLSFSEVYLDTDMNKAFNKFYELFCLFYELCFPVMKIKTKTTPLSNWITKGLRKSCNYKKILRYKYYNHKTDHNRNKYLNYNKILKKCINNSKRHTNNKYVTNHKNLAKATWDVINSESGKVSTDKYIYKIETDDNTITDPQQIAEAFNNYYINLTNNTNNDIKNTNDNSRQTNSIYLTPIDEIFINNIIMTLNRTNAEGYDCVCTKVVKKCGEEISRVLAHLINLSMETGTFPDRLKLSVVKPLYKKGSKSEMGNYRPITLIPIFSKIFEKVLHIKLMSFFTKYNIIKHDQYGFQKQKSTALASFNLVTEVLQSTNAKSFTTALFFDLSKAFDYVSHEQLLTKLERNGIRGPAYRWIYTYLENRQQCTEVCKLSKKYETQTYRSEFKQNKHGVPQGSVLGPLLFLVYINDLPDMIRHRTILFADDISVIVTTNNKLTLNFHESDINNTINLIYQWLCNNNLRINLDKSTFINFNDCNSLDINCNGQTIQSATKVKFLGTIIDHKLDWKEQVEKVCAKVNSFSFALYKLTKVATRQTAMTAYYAYVESILRYGLIVWGNSTNNKKVFIAQKKCVRAIFGVTQDVSCRPLFKKLNVLPLPCLYIEEIAKFVKQYRKEFYRQLKDISVRNRRNPNRLIIDEIPKTTRFKKNCYWMGHMIFNKIPKSIQELPINKFKKSLHEWLLQSMFYSVDEFLKHK